MVGERGVAWRFLALGLLLLVACSPGSGRPAPPPPATDRTVTVGSFDFTENELLAELYSQALEAGGFDVRREFNLGPREFVSPALVRGLVDLVPEYASTALAFLSVGEAQPGPDVAATHADLVRSLASGSLTALAPAPAQDVNTFVVTRRIADRLNVRNLSELAAAAPQLVFGGPPECPSRPFCLAGLERVYGLRFKEVVALDAGGPLTRQALRDGGVDVALLFSTDPDIGSEGFIELADDRRLQPADNVTPLVRREVVARAGPRLSEAIDAVSGRLSTAELRGMNAEVARGADVATVAAGWLRAQGLR